MDKVVTTLLVVQLVGRVNSTLRIGPQLSLNLTSWILRADFDWIHQLVLTVSLIL